MRFTSELFPQSASKASTAGWSLLQVTRPSTKIIVRNAGVEVGLVDIPEPTEKDTNGRKSETSQAGGVAPFRPSARAPKVVAICIRLFVHNGDPVMTLLHYLQGPWKLLGELFPLANGSTCGSTARHSSSSVFGGRARCTSPPLLSIPIKSSGSEVRSRHPCTDCLLSRIYRDW
jgi:hypothetical protein